MTASVSQFVTGAVINDYGLDNVPFVMNNPATAVAATAGSMLVAVISWNVAFFTYQSTGKSPAVNVTDSAGNLWRQIGLTSGNSGSRSAIWCAINARQTSWVSVALTGWAFSTSYVIAEITGLPSTMQAVSLDFFQKNDTGSAVSTLTVPSGTATTADICFAVLGMGTNTTAVSTPAGWTLIGSTGGSIAFDETCFAYWIANQGAGAVAFAPTWTTAAPASGFIVGLKQAVPAPIQGRPQFPRVVVEACFGAAPGDWTQSVDYTYAPEGLSWTDITTRCIGSDSQIRISVSRGRQYELSQEETGEIRIALDNHDGGLTFGNTASPFFPNVIPGVPIRVTAWWTQPGGLPIQYPIAFGYVERWPQEWPDLPQWGFSTLVATDAFGPLASTTLPSAVEGDIRKDYPYAYFPTDEQYSFTTQSLAPIKEPIDANGLIAVNKAFGNNRFGAYRDGLNSAVTTGQALNLLGDQDTTFGVGGYQAQDTNNNGPGLFYSDPGLPTNGASGTGSFSFEFWFMWGNGTSFKTTLLSVFGPPSSYYSKTGGVGGVITVGINTNGTSGISVNGTTIATATSNPAFNQVNFTPQHFAMTIGPNGVTCFLNGQVASTSVTVPNISSIKAYVLGPSRYSYDTSFLISYSSYNFVAGHLAIYSQELTPTMITNHFHSGVNGFVGVSLPYRFAQTLTWGLLGLKRGGVMWAGAHGTSQNTLASEAYNLEGATGASVVGQLAQTDQGRCYSQGNGSIIYMPRWSLYNQPVVATFGDNGTTEVPFLQETAYSLDNTFIYNQVNSVQNRGPNTVVFYQQTNFPSQLSFFNRSGLQYQTYAMSVFDVYGVVDWSMARYNNPIQRIDQITLNPASAQGKLPATFGTVLALELEQNVTVTRRPISGPATANLAVTGAIQRLAHDIGANMWSTTLQVTPKFPTTAALTAVSGAAWSFTASGTPALSSYFIVTTAQAASIAAGHQFTDTSNPGVTFTVVDTSPPSGGFVNVIFEPNAAVTMNTPDVVTQFFNNTLGSSYLSW